MQPKAALPLKGTLKFAECEKDGENLERQPTSQYAMTTQLLYRGISSQTALKSSKLPQLLQLCLHMCKVCHCTVAASTSMISAHAMQKCCIRSMLSCTH